MGTQNQVRTHRKAYEAPSVARIIVDPVREMLVDCTASPGKNPPGCSAEDPSCCSVSS